jgi:predicted AlkP superfamily phosphohydrolase/phosphomutase
MDRIVGEVAERFVDDDTMLMIVSDHGFHTFRRGVNLNTWLVKNGFMALKGQGLADADGNYQRLEDFLDPNGRFFKNVDWSRTQAYCLGLGSMFINLRGRERQGAVNPSEYEDVRDAIIKGLLELEDPEHLDQRVVINVYKREDIFQGPNLPVAPDLFVGFDNPYRVSWQTAAGGIPPQIFEDNLNNWSGDHCSVAPDITGGIFFANRSLPEGRRSIMDIGPTVLQALGLEVPGGLDGRSLLNAPADAR